MGVEQTLFGTRTETRKVGTKCDVKGRRRERLDNSAVAYPNTERPHQGIGNVPIVHSDRVGICGGPEGRVPRAAERAAQALEAEGGVRFNSLSQVQNQRARIHRQFSRRR